MSSSFRRNRTRKIPSSRNQVSNTESFPKGRQVPFSLTGPATTVFERVGTKPWIGGLTLTSSGLREFDQILGGGQPLGTAILIEEDRWTQDLCLALVRYWAAEAVAQQQNLSLVATLQEINGLGLEALDSVTGPVSLCCQEGIGETGLQSFKHMLPRDLHLDKTRAKFNAVKKIEKAVSKSEQSSSLLGFGTIEEDDDFDEEEAGDGVADSDEGLKNAWQYKVSVQKERLGAPVTSSKNASGVKTYCHSYDLSKKMKDQHQNSWSFDNQNISVVNCACEKCPIFSCQNLRSCAIDFYRTCIKHIHDKVSAQSSTVIRMLIMNAPVRISAIAVPLLLSYIRTHSLPVVILLTVRPWLRSTSTNTNPFQTSYTQSLISLRRSSDAVFTCEGFGAMLKSPPPEFSDLAGILSIRKLALQSLSHFADSTTNRRPPANRYGMKRDRRKMHIRMLHLPPEDFSAGGSSVGSGARSGAGQLKNDKQGRVTALQPGLGCATNTRAGSDNATSLEF